MIDEQVDRGCSSLMYERLSYPHLASAQWREQISNHAMGGVPVLRLRQPATHTWGTEVTQTLLVLCQELTAQLALPAHFAHQVISAFQEAYNNVIIHAYEGVEGKPIEILFEVTEECVLLSLRDQGIALSDTPPPIDLSDCPIELLPEGGMGLTLIAASMDHVERTVEGPWNRLTMTKWF